jgi:hypothetical protein
VVGVPLTTGECLDDAAARSVGGQMAAPNKQGNER